MKDSNFEITIRMDREVRHCAADVTAFITAYYRENGQIVFGLGGDTEELFVLFSTIQINFLKVFLNTDIPDIKSKADLGGANK